MAAEKSDAIVLRVVDFSETSCVVTLMTREFGKITALAKGARRRKSPFEAALDVLAICRIVFLRKSSGAMDLLTEAKLEKRFRSSATELERLYAGYYVVELLRLLTDDHDPHPEAYDLAVQTIERIDSNGDVRQAMLRFELGLLTVLGHQPILDKCAGCGRSRADSDRVSFGLNAGGVLCQNCRSGQRHVISLSSAAWRFLHLAMGTVRVRGNFPPLDSQVPVGEIRQLLNKYITHLLGFPPRLHNYIKNIH